MKVVNVCLDQSKTKTFKNAEPTPSTASDPGERMIIPGRRQKPIPAHQAPHLQQDLPSGMFTEIVTNARDMVEMNAYAKKRYKEKQVLRAAQSTDGVNIVVHSPVQATSMQRSQSDRIGNLAEHHSQPRATSSGTHSQLFSDPEPDSDEDSDGASPVLLPPASYSQDIVETQIDTAPVHPKSHRGRFSEPNVNHPNPPVLHNRSSTSHRAVPISPSSSFKSQYEEPVHLPDPVPTPVPPPLPQPTLRRMTQGPRSTPPPLGMRRAPNSTNLETKVKSQLPTKQKPFKVPFARPPSGPAVAGPSKPGVELTRGIAQPEPEPEPEPRMPPVPQAPSRPPVARPRQSSHSPSRSPSPNVQDPDTSFDWSMVDQDLDDPAIQPMLQELP